MTSRSSAPFCEISHNPARDPNSFSTSLGTQRLKSPSLLDVPRPAHHALVGIRQAFAPIRQFDQFNRLHLGVKFVRFRGCLFVDFVALVREQPEIDEGCLVSRPELPFARLQMLPGVEVVGLSRTAIDKLGCLVRSAQGAAFAGRAIVMKDGAKHHRPFSRKNGSHAAGIAALALLVLGVVLEGPGKERVVTRSRRDRRDAVE